LCTAFVRADAHELRRVLINLVSNAIEAMPQGGVLEASITLTTGKDGRLMALELRDTGVGLSETARSRLFEPYFTTRTHGTGLGLAIARRLVEEMNGTIELEPRKDLDRGTVARIQLPLLPATTESA
jgi:signal transduction histidine kinase